MKGMTIMYDYRGKKWGTALALAALVAMLAERFHGFILFKKLNAEQHFAFFEWCMLFGLFLIAYSREKFDDDRAKMIRLKALQIAFMVQQGVMLSMALMGSLTKESIPDSKFLFAFSGIGIIFYLLLFHAGLYFDAFWEYEDKGLWYNLKNMGKNKWSILVYFIVAAIALILFALLLAL